MRRRRLGELEVSAVGVGCATMTPFYDAPDPDSAMATIRRARELGVNFLDTADGYGRALPRADCDARQHWQAAGFHFVFEWLRPG